MIFRHDKDGDQHYLSLRWDTEELGPMLDHNAERQLGAYNFGLGQVMTTINTHLKHLDTLSAYPRVQMGKNIACPYYAVYLKLANTAAS